MLCRGRLGWLVAAEASASASLPLELINILLILRFRLLRSVVIAVWPRSVFSSWQLIAWGNLSFQLFFWPPFLEPFFGFFIFYFGGWISPFSQLFDTWTSLFNPTVMCRGFVHRNEGKEEKKSVDCRALPKELLSRFPVHSALRSLLLQKEREKDEYIS